MKRSLGSSVSLGALMAICPTTTDEHSPRNSSHVYGRDFQSVLDGLDEEGCCVEEFGHVSEKKRRLSVHQVKALEKNFEVENKLEPDRKVKLAQELDLQPRQVAVWFQNRRARWKTKQLERDYGVLKSNYETLNSNYENLQHDNEALLKEIKELKAKLNGEISKESNHSVKKETEEGIVPESADNGTPEITEPLLPVSEPPPTEEEVLNYNSNIGSSVVGAILFPDFKDGSSDSDSSAVLNEDNNSNGALQRQHLLMSPSTATTSSPSSSMNYFQFSKETNYNQPHQYVKMEEHNFFSVDEACNFFSDEQAPSLHWYCPEQWN